MQFLSNYGLFLLKTFTVLVAILWVIRAITRAASREPLPEEGRLRVRKLNRFFERLGDGLRQRTLPAKGAKQDRKRRAQEQKAARRGSGGKDRKIFVVDFEGDIRASAVTGLRHEVTAIVGAADKGDEVVLRLNSSGGVVHGYGLAAAQLDRLRSRELTLTVAVDGIAASGGYMMAVVGQKILAAPFAILGSIGVVATIPNVHRLLKKHDVDVELITAGEYKRTLTMLGENTDKGRQKFTEQIEEAHQLFKTFVQRYRPDLDLEKVGTGEHWYGSQALDLGLVDELITSDDYLLAASEEATLYAVQWIETKTLSRRFGGLVEASVRRVMRSGLQASQDSRYP